MVSERHMEAARRIIEMCDAYRGPRLRESIAAALAEAEMRGAERVHAEHVTRLRDALRVAEAVSCGLYPEASSYCDGREAALSSALDDVSALDLRAILEEP